MPFDVKSAGQARRERTRHRVASGLLWRRGCIACPWATRGMQGFRGSMNDAHVRADGQTAAREIRDLPLHAARGHGRTAKDGLYEACEGWSVGVRGRK